MIHTRAYIPYRPRADIAPTPYTPITIYDACFQLWREFVLTNAIGNKMREPTPFRWVMHEPTPFRWVMHEPAQPKMEAHAEAEAEAEAEASLVIFDPCIEQEQDQNQNQTRGHQSNAKTVAIATTHWTYANGTDMWMATRTNGHDSVTVHQFELYLETAQYWFAQLGIVIEHTYGGQMGMAHIELRFTCV